MNSLSQDELQEVLALVNADCDRKKVREYIKWLEKVSGTPFRGCGGCVEKIYMRLKMIVLTD